jgi:hypothetical protein
MMLSDRYPLIVSRATAEDVIDGEEGPLCSGQMALPQSNLTAQLSFIEEHLRSLRRLRSLEKLR